MIFRVSALTRRIRRSSPLVTAIAKVAPSGEIAIRSTNGSLP
jgi:hypothetical protein